MSIFPTKAHRLIPFCFALLVTFSCSKDSDLLADYVSPEGTDAAVGRFVVDDAFLVAANASVRLDVLSNDNFPDKKKVRITRTSNPRSGNVSINEDNTITYTPEVEEPVTEVVEEPVAEVVEEPVAEVVEEPVAEVVEEPATDSFTYTTEVVNEDQSVSEEEGTVTVEISPTGEVQQDSTVVSDNLEINNVSVLYWKGLFDISWTQNSWKAVEKSESGNAFQEYYYLAYSVDGLIQVWQATGDNKYLDDALDLIENTIDDAVPMSGANTGYLGWRSDKTRYGETRNLEGTNLWESFLYRYVATLLRIMHQSPNLRATASYQQRYDNILAFTKKHIWEKWYNRNSNLNDIYRSRTHMASHWARIAMELYLITGEQKYKTVFDNISYAGMPNYAGASLRSRIYPNPNNPQAYSWYMTWDTSLVQDVNHGDDVVSFLVTAYENGMYWDLNDMKALAAATNAVIWTNNSPLRNTANVDGSGGILDVNSHGFITAGRYDENLQRRIRDHYTVASLGSLSWQALGIAALNQRILDDGRPVYPEN